MHESYSADHHVRKYKVKFEQVKPKPIYLTISESEIYNASLLSERNEVALSSSFLQNIRTFYTPSPQRKINKTFVGLKTLLDLTFIRSCEG